MAHASLSALMLVAQQPLRLAGAEEPSQRWPLLLALAAVAALSLGIAGWLWWRRTMDEQPDEHAFRRLARGLGMKPADRRLVRTLAVHREVAPVALLVSPRALASAAGSFLAEHPADPSRPEILRIARSFGAQSNGGGDGSD